ncbi:Putative Dynein heavy chain [Rhizopus microsporus]|nr:Putative Dynein heavy chain [Rhizopus microsporus]
MDFTRMRVLSTFFSLLNKTVRNVLEYNAQHSDFPMTGDHLEGYITKRIIYSIIWSFTGDAKLDLRAVLGDFVRGVTTYELPPTTNGHTIIDYDIAVNTGQWVPWESKVPVIEIETHKVSDADMIIPTVDTIRHEEVLYSWLSEHKPLILCGPPGSGKTMTLFSALRKLPDMEVVGLNFSSATSPELVLKTFEQHCEYRKTPNGVVLSPLTIGRWLVVFCDEINLPATDKYNTQRVISFLRQLVEYNGFWRTSDKSWVTLERIQFVGACNPPTDLNVGLEKLKDTVIKVEELRKSLAIKKNQLELKQNQANEKIKQMVEDEKEAERKKADSLVIKNNLKIQTQEIEARRAEVDNDLANAEPAVKEAEMSVKSIKRQHLTEVRSMSNPPEACKVSSVVMTSSLVS